MFKWQFKYKPCIEIIKVSYAEKFKQNDSMYRTIRTSCHL